MKYTLTFLVIFTFLTTCSVAQSDIDPFNYYDSNGNQYLNRDEYGVSQTRARAFDYWDSDGDGLVETEEYTSGVRERYDFDRNQNLSRAEYSRDENLTIEFGAFDNLDINSDGQINEEEWSDGVENFSYRQEFDKDNDGRLNEEEMIDMTYDSSDLDKDGRISRDEYRFHTPR
jgi:Ca2+-binding EF-hand superfamily protein